MSARRLHDDQIDIDDELVRRLVDSQFPQWAALPLTPFDSTGTDNAIFRLGSELSVRLPLHPPRTARSRRRQSGSPCSHHCCRARSRCRSPVVAPARAIPSRGRSIPGSMATSQPSITSTTSSSLRSRLRPSRSPCNASTPPTARRRGNTTTVAASRWRFAIRSCGPASNSWTASSTPLPRRRPGISCSRSPSGTRHPSGCTATCRRRTCSSRTAGSRGHRLRVLGRRRPRVRSADRVELVLRQRTRDVSHRARLRRRDLGAGPGLGVVRRADRPALLRRDPSGIRRTRAPRSHRSPRRLRAVTFKRGREGPDGAAQRRGGA